MSLGPVSHFPPSVLGDLDLFHLLFKGKINGLSIRGDRFMKYLDLNGWVEDQRFYLFFFLLTASGGERTEV